MQYSSHLLVRAYIFVLTATWGSCWQYFTTLKDIKLQNSAPEKTHVHNEYYFGHCDLKKVIFYKHVHLDRLDILGKVFVRGWLDVMRIPTCIIMRAKSYYSESLRGIAYRFQMCVPRITYCHTQQRTKYHYYELYVPYDMSVGMDFDIYFYGPPNQTW